MTLQLASDSFGEAGLPIVVLHGLLGSARNWTGIAKQLGESHRVLALDLRNHGRSPWAEAMSFDDMAGDVAAFIERSGIAPVVLLGHSLGGKVAMRLALTRGDLVARLVVVDVAPVLYRHSLAEYIEAMRAVDLGRVTRRTEVDDQLGRTIPDTMMRAFLLQNLVRSGGLRLAGPSRCDRAEPARAHGLSGERRSCLSRADAVHRRRPLDLCPRRPPAADPATFPTGGIRDHRRRRPSGARRPAGRVPGRAAPLPRVIRPQAARPGIRFQASRAAIL